MALTELEGRAVVLCGNIDSLKVAQDGAKMCAEAYCSPILYVGATRA